MIRSRENTLRDLMRSSFCEGGVVAPVSLTLTVIATDPTRRAVEEALALARERYTVKVVQAPEREVLAQITRVFANHGQPYSGDVEIVLRSGTRNASRTCPFCRSAIATGAAVTTCRRCRATHHEECWSQNGGCTTLGCSSTPAAATSASQRPSRAGSRTESRSAEPIELTADTMPGHLRDALRQSLCQANLLAPVSLTLTAIATDPTSPAVKAALATIRERFQVNVVQAPEEEVAAQIAKLYRAPRSGSTGDSEVVLIAGTRMVGRNCPFCQTPIKPKVAVISCGRCGVPHHTDCWRQNSGCTTFGCTGARPTPRPSSLPRPRPISPQPVEDYTQWRVPDRSVGLDFSFFLAVLILVGILFFFYNILNENQNQSDRNSLLPRGPSETQQKAPDPIH